MRLFYGHCAWHCASHEIHPSINTECNLDSANINESATFVSQKLFRRQSICRLHSTHHAFATCVHQMCFTPKFPDHPDVRAYSFYSELNLSVHLPFKSRKCSACTCRGASLLNSKKLKGSRKLKYHTILFKLA